MGKRSAVVELFLGDMGSMQRELRPSTQREDQLTMETKPEQIAVKAVNQLPKSVVREIRTPRSVGAGGGRPPPATRWARGNSRPYRESDRYVAKSTRMTLWRPKQQVSQACSPDSARDSAAADLDQRDSAAKPNLDSKGPRRWLTTRRSLVTTLWLWHEIG